MNYRLRALVFAMAALLTLVIAQPRMTARTAPANADPSQAFAYFSETSHNLGFDFKRFYTEHGGIDIFGLPLTEPFLDANDVQVQYFERARFELRPDLPEAFRVTLSHVGRLATEGRADSAFAWQQGASAADRRFFPEAGHSLGGAFRWFWQQHGGLAVFGYPISEEFTEINPNDGQPYLVQYFERARFEYHPEHRGTDYEVMLGQLGRQLLERDPRAQAAAAPAHPITLLGEATTSYATSASERYHNIARAVAMFDGVMVPANTEFSFNAVGDFSEANGFVDGYAIVGGQLERVVGGGLCQVSTTLFRAVSNAGLQITRRQGHTFIVYFYENILGFDATVYTPSVDFRWFNDSLGPTYIAAASDPATARVTFAIWGYDDGRSVTYEGPYTRNWTQPGSPVWQYDAALPAGAVRQLVHGRPGVDVNYIRTVTLPDGQTLHNDNFYTHYHPWEDFYLYGPDVEPPDDVTILPPKQ